MKAVWTVRLAQSAERDYRDILRWTRANFGARQALVYGRTMTSALHALTAGPSLAGARLREDIGHGVYTLHVACKGRKGRHFVLFRVAARPEQPCIDVLRLLHDSMDLARHARATDDPAGGAE